VRPSRPEPAPPPPRQAYFGAETGWLETPILRRSDLSAARAGPLIVEEYDATCVVPPGANAELDAGGNILIALGSEALNPPRLAAATSRYRERRRSIRS
jgi:N-methylhydantoinase A